MTQPALQPSQIPVAKRRSSGLAFNLGPPVLPHAGEGSTSSAVQSPVMETGAGVASPVRQGSTPPASPGRITSPPGDLQSQVESLKSSLYASEQRCRDLMSSLASQSSPPSTPLGAPFVAVEKQLPALPHSDASFDLRRRAAETPAQKKERQNSNGDGKLGLSRIPVSTVTHAISFHPTPPSDLRTRRMSAQAKPRGSSRSNSPLPTSPTMYDSPTPGTRQQDGFLPRLDVGPNLSLTPPSFRRSESPVPNGRRTHASPSASSTSVIEGLHADLSRAKDHVERLKNDLRLSARTVATLTRQTEDLKDTKERMRVECEGLNNVISRKERLLQDVLERARTAESELQLQQSTRKTFEKSTQKQIQTMTTQLADAQLTSKKAETECSSMKEGMRSLKEQWARDVKGLRDEVKSGSERSRKEREEARTKHLQLVEMVSSQSAERLKIQQLAQDATHQSDAISKKYESELSALRVQLDESSTESREAYETASALAAELARLRRLMREPGRPDLDLAAQGNA